MKTDEKIMHPSFDVQGNENFTALCQLTLTACNRTDFPVGTFTLHGNCWLELAVAWEKLLEGGAAVIFLDAVHRIMWGLPCNKGRAKYDGIVQIVIEELLKDAEAFAAWDNYVACDVAITAIGNDSTPWIDNGNAFCSSVEHYHYLWDKMLLNVRYSKAKYLDKYRTYKEACEEYKRAIITLIPAANDWEEDRWFNESNIRDELKALYGVDYRNDDIEYSRILLMLMNSEDDALLRLADEAWYACNIKKMPMDLAEVIWPCDTEERIMMLFLVAAEATERYETAGRPQYYRKGVELHPVGVFEYSVLHDSWLYALMYEWFADAEGNDECVAEVKRKLFDIAMHC